MRLHPTSEGRTWRCPWSGQQCWQGAVSRIGLSATQRPIELIAHFLGGGGSYVFVNRDIAASEAELGERRGGPTDVAIIDVGHPSRMDLAVECRKTNSARSLPMPFERRLRPGMSSWSSFPSLHAGVREYSPPGRAGLPYLEERLRHLATMLWQRTTGSLSREIRLSAEGSLSADGGRARGCGDRTLELGIDVGTVDLVCQIGSPVQSRPVCKIASAGPGTGFMRIPRPRLFCPPTRRIDRMCRVNPAIRGGYWTVSRCRPAPLDVLAQQIVAAAASQSWDETELFDLCRRAMPHRDLTGPHSTRW